MTHVLVFVRPNPDDDPRVSNTALHWANLFLWDVTSRLEASTPTGGSSTAASPNTQQRVSRCDSRRPLCVLLWHTRTKKGAHPYTHMLHARLRSIQNKGIRRKTIHYLPTPDNLHRGRHCSDQIRVMLLVLLGLTCDIYRGHLTDQIWVWIVQNVVGIFYICSTLDSSKSSNNF